MMAGTVVQITMGLEMATVIPRILSRRVTMMEGTVVNLRRSMTGFVMFEIWTECVILMDIGQSYEQNCLMSQMSGSQLPSDVPSLGPNMLIVFDADDYFERHLWEWKYWQHNQFMHYS